jgi:hypothetical protein
MFVQAVLTRYELASDTNPVRAGTSGLQFSAGGPATFTTQLGDTVTCAVVAGQEIETGPLLSVGTVPAGTVGIVGR